MILIFTQNRHHEPTYPERLKESYPQTGGITTFCQSLSQAQDLVLQFNYALIIADEEINDDVSVACELYKFLRSEETASRKPSLKTTDFLFLTPNRGTWLFFDNIRNKGEDMHVSLQRTGPDAALDWNPRIDYAAFKGQKASTT